MASWERILQKARNNPGGLRLSEAFTLAEAFGFRRRSGGKHPHVFKRKGFRVQLNFQDDDNGNAKPYQVRQLLNAIDEIESEI